MTDPIWWFYLYWLPKFLDQNCGSDYSIVFMICGSAYVAALLVIHLLAPRLQPSQVDGA